MAQRLYNAVTTHMIEMRYVRVEFLKVLIEMHQYTMLCNQNQSVKMKMGHCK